MDEHNDDEKPSKSKFKFGENYRIQNYRFIKGNKQQRDSTLNFINTMNLLISCGTFFIYLVYSNKNKLNTKRTYLFYKFAEN